MLSHEFRDRLRCYGLIESAQMIGCLYSWGAYFHMGSYIHQSSCQNGNGCLYSWGDYIQGVPIIPILQYIGQFKFSSQCW